MGTIPKMPVLETKKVLENGEIGRIIREDMSNELCENYVLVGEEGTCLSDYYLNFSEAIQNFEIRNSDIMVISYPKAGTTWTQEMVWLIANNLDFEGAEVNLDKRFPHLELCTVYDFKKMNEIYGTKRPEWVEDSIHFASKQDSPRFIKTHLPLSLLPQEIQNGSKTPKMIYVMRNPKDVCVSYYHHGKLLQGWQANLQDFCKLFLADRIMFGSFWRHVLGFWEQRNSPNVLIITYEEMKNNLKSVIKKVAVFLGKTLSDDQLKLLLNHLSFDSMKNNRAVNCQDSIENRKNHNLVLEEGTFIRSGTVGSHKEEMSPEIIEEFNAWIKENIAGSNFGQQYNYLL